MRQTLEPLEGIFDLEDSEHIFWGGTAPDPLGFGVPPIGDISGDGIPDLAMGENPVRFFEVPSTPIE